MTGSRCLRWLRPTVPKEVNFLETGSTQGRNQRHRSIGFSAGVIFVATLFSRLSGFLREVVMAAFFGTSAAYDAWLMASVLPNLLFSSINGAITVSMIPIMTEADTNYSPGSGQRFINEVFTAVVLVALILIAVGEIFTPILVQLIAPGFHGHELELAIGMTRIMLPTILFWGLGGLVVGILQEQEAYLAPALSPVAINMVRITTIIVFGHFWGIQGVAYGFLLAVLSQLFVTLPALRRHGFHLRFRWHLRHPLLKKLLRMSGPFFITSSVGALGLIVDRILASNLVTGSIAALQYSYVLVQIPVGLLISSLATPIYTRLAQHHSHRDPETFRALSLKGFRLVLMAIVPITIWFIVLREPLLRLLYQRGAFNNHSTDISAGTLLYFSLGLPASAIAFYLQRLFFATQDTSSPARFSVLTIIFNIVGDIVLVRVLKVDGLALATALAGWVNAVLLTAKSLRPQRGQNLRLRRTIFALLAGGSGTAAAAYAIRAAIHLNHTTGVLPLAGGLTLAMAVSGLVFIVILRLLRYPEVAELARQLRLRLARRVRPS
ncbi:MAG: murein biosynthesis integral membrane protein MurJ [Thermaerobacter sp.]|nr:murein biosynthesis integral membrane protein MurJ [Thermaerobacter sp.]